MMRASGVRYSCSDIEQRRPLVSLAIDLPNVHASLRRVLALLDSHYEVPRYVEFVVEDEALFIVQNMKSRHGWPASEHTMSVL